MNRANLAVLVVVTMILIAVLNGQTKQQQPSGLPGRYQLSASEHTIIGLEVTEKVILRIDTQTGNVDQWMSGKDKNGNLVDTWLRTGDVQPKRQN